ncbi:MAG: MtrB/PioB family decaheme-associated outer membrane protein [Wenzhouxiangella sp.]
MNIRIKLDPRLLLPVLALGFSAHLLAQDDFFFDDESLDELEEVIEYDNVLEIGAGYLDQGTRHFGRNVGVSDKGFSPLIDFRARGRPAWDGDSTAFWRVEGYRLGLDSRRLEFAAGQQGSQTFGLSWREMPNYQIEGGQTPFVGVGSGFLSLPPGWVAEGDQTSGMLNLRNQLNPVNIGTDRHRLDLSYWRSALDRWTFDVNYRHETKDGSRLAGGIFGFTGGNPRSAHLPVPVNQTTRILDTSIEYGAGRWLLGLAYHGSFFENDQPSISWQNPFGQQPQWQPGTGFPNGVGRLSGAPDNDFHQLRTYGAWHFGARTQFNADFAIGRMEQDDDFLSFTVNPFIQIDEALPASDLDGKIKTTLLNLRLSTQAVDRLNLVFNYRFDDRDNQTPMLAWRIIGADSQAQVSPDNARINLPYSYRKNEIKSDATWRLAGRTRLVGGLKFMREDRDNFAEVAELDEWTIRAGVRGAIGQRTAFNVDYEHADRQYDEYEGRNPFVAGHVPGSVAPDDFENHPNLRKFNMADRERDQLRLRMDFQPLDVFNLGASYQYSVDDYDDDRFGLDEAKVQSWTLDGGYYPNENVSLSWFYTYDRIDTDQSGRDFGPNNAFDPNRDWFADHSDRVDTLGLTIELPDIARRFNAITRIGLNRRLDLGMDFLFVRTRGEIDVTTGPALNAEPLPDTVNRLNAYKVWARYSITPQWFARLSVEHERFDSQNFALDQVEIDTLANVLLLGQQSPSYNVTWVMVGLGYRF